MVITVSNRMKRDLFETNEAFPGDELSIKAVDKYKKQCRNNISPDEIEMLKQGFVNAIRQPVSISYDSVTGAKPRSMDCVDENLLFKQIEESLSKRSLKFILHNFDAHSQYHTCLHTWGVFQITTEKIMRPICYFIQNPKRIVELKEAKDESQKRLLFQQQIAIGTITCMSFINTVEELMGCMLVRVILSKKRLAFLFEWYNEPMFLFIIVFDMLGENAIKDMSFHRSDFFVTQEIDILDNEETKTEVEKQRDEMEKAIYSQRLIERDATEVIFEKRKAKTYFISFYGDKIESTSMDTLKNSQMRYLGYGYALKEDHGNVILT